MQTRLKPNAQGLVGVGVKFERIRRVTGYLVGTLFHFNTAKKRTISIEVGMQNAGLGTNLAMTFFVATNPMAVVPCAISCAWHSISGTILANIFARRQS